jgi:hypothetical protein
MATVEPAEGGEEGDGGEERGSLGMEAGAEARPCGDGGGGGEDDAYGEFFGQPACLASPWFVHEDEIEQGGGEEDGVFVAGIGAHAGDDQPEQGASDDDACGQEGFAMVSVEAVSFAERGGWGGAGSVEDAVGDVDEPGAEGEQQRGLPGKVDSHSASEEP